MATHTRDKRQTVCLDTLMKPDEAATTAVYHLLRLRRVAPLNGPDGPGDRGWLWPLLALGAGMTNPTSLCLLCYLAGCVQRPFPLSSYQG